MDRWGRVLAFSGLGQLLAGPAEVHSLVYQCMFPRLEHLPFNGCQSKSKDWLRLTGLAISKLIRTVGLYSCIFYFLRSSLGIVRRKKEDPTS